MAMNGAEMNRKFLEDVQKKIDYSNGLRSLYDELGMPIPRIIYRGFISQNVNNEMEDK